MRARRHHPLRLLLAASGAAALAAGCDGGECGPGDSLADGVLMSAGDDTLTFGAFTSSPNNDCPTAGHPTSLTIEGKQVAPEPAVAAFLTFCVPAPDRIGAGAVPLSGEQAEGHVWIVDVQGDREGCRLRRDRSLPPAGTIRFLGYCADGADPAGYAIELAAEVPGLRSCAGGSDDEPVTILLSGAAAVVAE